MVVMPGSRRDSYHINKLAWSPHKWHHSEGLAIVPLQLKDPLGLFVKRGECRSSYCIHTSFKVTNTQVILDHTDSS